MSSDLTIYMLILSPYARTVVGTANHLGIKHKEQIVNPFKGENKRKWYLKINPKGLVPAIKDGDHCMGESLDICRYLIETRKIKTPFYPMDDKERLAQIDDDLKLTDELGTAVGEAAFNCYWGIKLGKTNPTKDERHRYLEAVHAVFEKMDRILAERKTKFFNSNGKS